MSKRSRQSTSTPPHPLHQLLSVGDLCDELRRHLDPCAWFVLQMLDRACAALVKGYIHRLGAPHLLVWCIQRPCPHQRYVRRCCCSICRGVRHAVSPLTDGVVDYRGLTFRLHKVRVAHCKLVVDGVRGPELHVDLAWRLYWDEKERAGVETNRVVVGRDARLLGYKVFTWSVAKTAFFASLAWGSDLAARIDEEKRTIKRRLRRSGLF